MHKVHRPLNRDVMQRTKIINRTLLWAASFALIHTLVVGILYFGKTHPVYPYLDPMIFGALLCLIDFPLYPVAIKWFHHAPDLFVSYILGGIMYAVLGVAIGSWRKRRTEKNEHNKRLQAIGAKARLQPEP